VIETYGRELLEFLGVSRLSQSDDVDANQLITLLKMKDEELQMILHKGFISIVIIYVWSYNTVRLKTD